MRLPQGYEPYEIPADYDELFYLEDQMRQFAAAAKLDAAEHILEIWKTPWDVAQVPFVDRLKGYVESLKETIEAMQDKVITVEE